MSYDISVSKVRPMVATVALALAACAGAEDIDRTQPNRLPKSMFDGAWYVQSTVIDVPGTSGAAVQGYPASRLEKIRWEVQEKLLVAYRAYQEVPGTDVDGAARTQTTPERYKENPVAAFPIVAHFDIKREYNAATGEQTNVIVENAADRPWHARDYIRVDWTSSQIDPLEFSSTEHRASYFVQQHEEDPDAMRVFDRDGQRLFFDRLATVAGNAPPSWQDRVEYFDMVGRFLLEPQKIDYDYGDGTKAKIPLCYFIRYAGRNFRTTACGPTEVKVRTAFLRARQRNYEPIVVSDRDLGKFGILRDERFTVDPRLGVTESGRVTLGTLHNIWQQAYETEADGSLKVGQDGKYVRIPIADRAPRPIVYHLNREFPCELVGAAREVAASWSKAFRRTVAIAQGLLDRTAGDIDSDLAQIPEDAVPEMFQLHLNGWVQKEPGADYSCANLERDESLAEALYGDLRYNFLVYIPDRQMMGPTGVSWLGSDPETGETIAARVHAFGYSLNTYAQSATEIVRLLAGDLQLDDVISGDYVRRHIAKQSEVLAPQVPARAAQLRGVQIRDLFLSDKVQSRIAAMRAGGLEQELVDRSQRALELVAASPLADNLLNEEIVRGLAPRLTDNPAASSVSELSSDEKQLLSPLNWGASREALSLERLRVQGAAQRHIELGEFSDEALQGLALDVFKKFGKVADDAAIWQYLREQIFRDLMEHEVGHSVGLAHNYAGSYDAINFRNEYWKLRQENLKQRKAQDVGGGALSFDELYEQARQTESQIRGRMREYQYSSVMDYGNKFNAAIHGLGKYDHAAITFAYGGFVEVFDKASEAAKAAIGQRFGDRPQGNTRALDRDIHPCHPRFESRPNLAFSPVPEQWHYSSLWNMICDGCDKDGKTAALAARRFRRWAEVKREQDEATAACRKFVDGGNGTTLDFNQAHDRERDLEVPYTYCDDRYVRGTVSCQQWDLGADPYEMAHNVISTYNSYHFLRNFKRDRYGFDSYAVYNSAANRYFSYLPSIYKHWLFHIGEIDDPTLENYWTVASWNGFNLLMEELAKPEFGTYCRGADGACQASAARWTRFDPSTAPAKSASEVVIGRDVGRRRYSRFDYESGYGFDERVVEVGQFWPHLAALQALTDSSGTFFGVEAGTDFTRFLVPYYIVFEDELRRVFESSVTDDYARFAPRLTADGTLRVKPAATLALNVREGSGVRRIEIDPATGAELAPDPADALPVDLENNFTLKFYSLLYGMAEFRSLYSLRFADRQLVFRVGSGEEVQAADGAEVVSCADPIGGVVYGAIREADAAAAGIGGAVQLIERCRAQAAEYAQLAQRAPDSSALVVARSKLNDTVRWLNFMRSLYQLYGSNL